MINLIFSFLSGYIISLSGAIAPSNMSATAMQITMEKSPKAGYLFGLGSALVEMIYIRLYFIGFDAFIRENKIFLLLQWIMLVIFFIIGLILFRNSYKPRTRKQKKRKDFSTYTLTKAFMLGVLLKAINPLQFIFWTFWSSYLISNGWLKPDPANYNAFCLGLGVATFTGFALYVKLGNYLETKSIFSKQIFSRIIAMFLCLTSVAWAIKLIVKPEGLII
jgi:threonine/homoserine/homoserine lactone efflux protein